MEWEKVTKDHEGRIRILEQHDSITATKLDITNKILAAIALMLGGSIITFLFRFL